MVFQIPERIKIELPHEIPFHSRMTYFQYAILHAATLRHSLRYFQALVPREAIEVYRWICGQADKYELIYPQYRDIQEHLESYLIWSLTQHWQVCPIPIKSRVPTKTSQGE